LPRYAETAISFKNRRDVTADRRRERRRAFDGGYRRRIRAGRQGQKNISDDHLNLAQARAQGRIIKLPRPRLIDMDRD
jgi:hypothetical protein